MVIAHDILQLELVKGMKSKTRVKESQHKIENW